MTTKLSISVTTAHAKLIEDAVNSGDYASASEVIREALRGWRISHAIDVAIEDGLASGWSEPKEPIDSIIDEARAGFKTTQRA